MPRHWSAETEAALNADTLAAAWLIELTTPQGVLRAWDKVEPMTYDGDAYEALFDMFGIAGEIGYQLGLTSEPLTITFDASRADDDTSFIGRLVDRDWHGGQVRVRQVAFVVTSNFVTPIGDIVEWNGRMSTIADPHSPGEDAEITLTCEGGLLGLHDRRLTIYSDESQRKRDPNDGLLRHIATKPRQAWPFGGDWDSVPGGSYISANNPGVGRPGIR